MSTTQLFAELLVIGIGALIWIAILIAGVSQLSFQNISTNANIFTLAPIVGVAYVLGIIVDRISYGLFRKLEERTRNKIIEPNTSPSADDRERYILTNSEELSIQITYNRSRLRVCRSWIINFSLIAAASAIWGDASKLKTPILLPILSLSLAVITFLVWLKLSKDYYINIQASYEFLAESILGNEAN